MSKHARTKLEPQITKNQDQRLETREEVSLAHGEDTLANQLYIEIECPRCEDIMELFSKFDYLSYYCGSCGLELNVN
jgi:uncharacterized protein (DUF983 family)